MPRISKKVLLQDAVKALQSAGWEVSILSKVDEHPMRLRIRRGASDIIARVYIWTVSHGGGRARPSHEHRIQITSDVARFQVEEGEKTLVLGWSAKFGVYAGFDVSRHAGRLGSSPSMQIGQAALLRAGEVGAAMHTRRRDEVAIAVRPDILGDYVQRLELLHDKATAGQQIEEIRRDREAVPNADEQVLDEARRVLVEMEAGTKPRFGDPNEVEQRQTIIKRLKAIEDRLDALPPAKIGHNQPPEPIEASHSPEADAKGASKIIKQEVNKPTPNIPEVIRHTRTLAEFSKKLINISSTKRGIGKKVKDKMQDRIADFVVGSAVTGSMALHEQIGAVLTSIATWLKMLF